MKRSPKEAQEKGRERERRDMREREIEEAKAKGNAEINEEKNEIDSNVEIEKKTFLLYFYMCLLTRKKEFIKD